MSLVRTPWAPGGPGVLSLERTLNWWQAAVLGLVEGITEYLPISSTGHLVIASGLLGLQDSDDAAMREAVKSFEIVVQGGAILAVLGLYWPRFVKMLRGLIGQDRDGLRLLINIAIAFLPFAIVAKLTNTWLKEHLMHTGPVTAALIVGGVYMILVERWYEKKREAAGETGGEGGGESGMWGTREIESITPVQAAFLGLLQCVALIPGTSRSMMTITGGMFVGLRPAAAAEFSFLLGLPTLGAATLYSLYKNFSEAKNGPDGRAGDMVSQLGVVPILIGMLVAAVSAAIAVKWLVAFLNRHGLTAFGWYRIVLGICLLGLAVGGVIKVGEVGG
jgi:undecaprenyl-diphosphatase